MPHKIVLFGPVASGKSTHLRRAKSHYGNGCLTVEMDDVVLEKGPQERFARHLLAGDFDRPLFMTAGMIDAANLRLWGGKVVRLVYSGEVKYMDHVGVHRSARIGVEYTRHELLEWYREIRALESGGFALELDPLTTSEDDCWDRIRALADAP